MSQRSVSVNGSLAWTLADPGERLGRPISGMRKNDGRTSKEPVSQKTLMPSLLPSTGRATPRWSVVTVPVGQVLFGTTKSRTRLVVESRWVKVGPPLAPSGEMPAGVDDVQVGVEAAGVAVVDASVPGRIGRRRNGPVQFSRTDDRMLLSTVIDRPAERRPLAELSAMVENWIVADVPSSPMFPLIVELMIVARASTDVEDPRARRMAPVPVVNSSTLPLIVLAWIVTEPPNDTAPPADNPI